MQEYNEKYDLNQVIKEKPVALNELRLLLNCEQTDEFGLAEVAKKLHETLNEHNINHDYDLYSDPKAALTPHILGIGYSILPGIRYCIKYIGT